MYSELKITTAVLVLKPKTCPFQNLTLKLKSFLIPIAPTPENVNPCYPSPCGPNSQCKENNGVPICSCLPGFEGSAPACRPECVVSSECSYDKACIQHKCKDPCPGVCGASAECRVINHSPICYCRNGFTGNPFTVCNPIPRMFFFTHI